MNPSQPYGDREAGIKDAFGNQWYIATPLGGRPVPAGFRTVTPSLRPRGTAQLIAFLKQTFNAREVERYAAPDGTILNAQIQIGDSILELGEAHGEFQPMPTMFYLYVEDCDACYQRAIQGGATSIEAPADQPYGDRRAAVKDAWDNQWYMATHVRDVPHG